MEDDLEQLKLRVSRLGRHAFADFVMALFNSGSGEPFRRLTDVGEDAFYQPILDSYGGSMHSAFLLHSPPIDLFEPARALSMQDPRLVQLLGKLRNHYHGQRGAWGMVDPFLREDDALSSVGFLTNIVGVDHDTYQSLLIPAYQRLKRYCGLKKPQLFVGSADSFVERDAEGTHDALTTVEANHSSGIAIAVGSDSLSVRNFSDERYIPGLGGDDSWPAEPVFVQQAIEQRAVLHEFESLLNGNVSELRLEAFLKAHYRDVFGPEYDRIETQLWLRFPELDLVGKDRRLDMFLRNSVVGDWELFEVKRPIQMTKTHRDAPALVSAVTDAISQNRNYLRTLSQASVRQFFAQQGINYFEPTLTVVIGRTPNIPKEQWRWLLTEHRGKAQIRTYDELLSGLQVRLQDRYEVLHRLTQRPA